MAMLDIFKKKENNKPADVKVLRDTLLRFIKRELQKTEGGEGRNIKGLHLFILEAVNDKHVYEAAIYAEEPSKFKDEVQKIADDYAVDLPVNWVMDIAFTAELPAEAVKIDDLDVALFIRTKDNTIQKTASAYIRVLSGEAEKKEYQISSTDGKINIGREKKAQVEDGFFRTNHIAFPGDSKNGSNKFISRQHAHIEWDNETSSFMFYADEGGVPPQNKVKIRSAVNETLNKLNSTEIGHKLTEGDQIVLGDSAVIEFSYKTEA
jgi:hypothetical protein